MTRLRVEPIALHAPRIRCVDRQPHVVQKQHARDWFHPMHKGLHSPKTLEKQSISHSQRAAGFTPAVTTATTGTHFALTARHDH